MSLLPTVVRNSTRSSSSPAIIVSICLRIASARSFATEITLSSSSDIPQVTLSPNKPKSSKYRLRPHPRPAVSHSHTSTTDSACFTRHVKGNGSAAPVRLAVAKTKPRPSNFAAPSITPRLIKSSALRAAKQEADQAAVTKTALKKGRPKIAPSSFKAVVN